MLELWDGVIAGSAYRLRKYAAWPQRPKCAWPMEQNGMTKRSWCNAERRRGMSLVVVSNRVARAHANEAMAGGLASALLPVVRDSGAIWIGSSGSVRDDQHKAYFAEIEALGAGAVATIDMPAAHYRGFYEGFANSALWPALHSRPDLIRTCTEHYGAYRRVNELMARALLRFTSPEAMIWVHDYHYLTMAAELRGLGVSQPLGF